MLARSSILKHPSGSRIETPLLVPSFSSKGWGFKKNGKSEITDVVEIAKEYISNSMLISAYDLYYGHIPKGYERIPSVIFVDSGGYEVSTSYDFSAVHEHAYSAKEWNKDALCTVYDTWPNTGSAIFVSYDHPSNRKSIDKQIVDARQLLRKYPKQLHNILLKPYPKRDILDIDKIAKVVSELGEFDIVGVTEKELGKSMLERLRNVARLRISLDQAGVSAPIHVFGSLDPLSSILFFIAGAEIFDGLTWLRYSYYELTSVYRYNDGVLRGDIHQSDDLLKARILGDNISCLRKLEIRMKGYLKDGDIGRFDFHDKVLRSACDLLQGMLEGVI